MANIIIFGGHGRVGLLLEPILVERGDTVTAVIRNPDHAADVQATGARPLVADIEQLDAAALAALIEGHDAVVWTAGAGGGTPARTHAVDHEAAVRTMQAAAQAGVKRYVMVSYFDASPDHGVAPDSPFFHYAEAKAAADEHLRATDLDWTILGPSLLTFDTASGKIDTQAVASTQISRANVALAVAATLADETTIHRTIRFNDGEIPITKALRVE